MSIMHFASVVAAAGAGPAASLASFNASDLSIVPNQATAGVRLTSAGAQDRLQDVTYTLEEVWLDRGVAADFQVFATLNSGSLTSGPTGSWLDLTSTREWLVRTTGVGFSFLEANITLEIRLKASPFTVLASSTHQLNANTEV